MTPQQLIFTNDIGTAIDSLAVAMNPSKVFILVDSNTVSFVLPRLQEMSDTARTATVIQTLAGDMHKNIDSLSKIWKQLTDGGATRGSLLINVGGGVVTDMGAFAAATFKRGMRFINLPTTLLGAVDASVGGKTGINFAELKNQIGVFSNAEAVIISTLFFNTLTSTELRSGYGEMLKHGLLKDEKTFTDLLGQTPGDIDPDRMLDLLKESVLVKKEIVEQDPTEQGLRRALNLGHTAGHAFESLAMHRRSPIPHGYAVVYGLLTDMVLSHSKYGFPSPLIHSYADYVRRVYGPFEFTCDDYPLLLRFMAQDKKNAVAGQINFSLLAAPGELRLDTVVADDDIRAALDITRDLMGI